MRRITLASQGASSVYARILIPTDGSELAGRGLRDGLALAAALGATVAIITVSETWPLGAGVADQAVFDDWRRSSAASAKLVLDTAADLAASAGVTARTVYVPEERPADAIVKYAEAHDTDLIVMASHGRRGLQRLVLGSQTSEVLSRSSIPVLVVR
jgi:nucleotide-binding universal stress UspA family protein